MCVFYRFTIKPHVFTHDMLLLDEDLSSAKETENRIEQRRGYAVYSVCIYLG